MAVTFRNAWRLLFLGMVLVSSGACQSSKSNVTTQADEAGPAEPAPTQKESPQGALPNVVRPGLRATMERHAEHAAALGQAVALGLHEDTVRHATALLEEPKLARPIDGQPGALNEQLPPKLLDIDEAFRTALTGLRDAASARDDDATLARFAEVLRSCRDCHRAYNPSQQQP